MDLESHIWWPEGEREPQPGRGACLCPQLMHQPFLQVLFARVDVTQKDKVLQISHLSLRCFMLSGEGICQQGYGQLSGNTLSPASNTWF